MNIWTCSITNSITKISDQKHILCFHTISFFCRNRPIQYSSFWGFQITFRYMSLRLLWKEIGLLQGPLTDNTQHERDRYSCLGVIRTLNPNMRAVADPRCRPCSHWDRCFSVTLSENIWCPWSSYSVMRVIRVSFSSSSNVVPAVRIR